ncbi:ketopantoate reductase [Fennellomyces sp. T-0311]|nr:ketopantoate reductase [Fennellomyces sp. T-0311]
MNKAVRILTVGTGAVGSVYSWGLAQSCQVTTVCRSNYETVRDHGFTMESAKFGRSVFKPHNGMSITGTQTTFAYNPTVVRSVKEATVHGPFDYILVTLKALPDVYDITEIIAPAMTPKETAIVLIQNGLGVEAPIVQRFPENPLISIVAYIATLQDKPGYTRHLGGEKLRLGILDPSAEPAAKMFMDRLRHGNMNVGYVGGRVSGEP